MKTAVERRKKDVYKIVKALIDAIIQILVLNGVPESVIDQIRALM